MTLKFDFENARNILFYGSPYDFSIFFNESEYFHDNYKIFDKAHYLWNNTSLLWEQVEPEEVVSKIGYFLKKFLNKLDPDDEYFDLLKTDFKTINNKWTNYTNITHISKFMFPYFRDKELYKKLDSSIWEIPIKYGKILNLKTGKIRRRKKTDFWTFEFNASPTSDKNKINEVKDFLMKLSNNNEIRYNYLKKILGLSLSGHNPQSVIIFTGEGSNGKSTLINFIKELFADSYKTIDPALVINKSSTGLKPKPELLDLQNGRFYLLSETDDGDKLNEKFIKNLSGGDEFTARQLFGKKPIKFTPYGKLFIISNFKPNFNITDKAILRRIKYLKFDAKFTSNPKENEFKKNPNYEKYFKENLMDAFLTVLLEGCQDYINDKYNIDNPKGLNDMKEYLNDIDNVLKFTDDNISITNNDRDFIKKSQLWIKYNDWVIENKYYKEAYKRNSFDKRINELFGYPIRDKTHGWIYKKINFKFDESDTELDDSKL